MSNRLAHLSDHHTSLIFRDEEAARRDFESLRWPDGRICPHCGLIDNAAELKGKSTRPGVYKCRDCRKPFTATIGTLYERSHIPLHKRLLATDLMCSSKNGMSAPPLYRMLGFGSYRTAWFMAHRIREGMREARILGSMGAAGKNVEADETWVGGKETNKHKASKRQPGTQGGKGKEPVLSLVGARRRGRVLPYRGRDGGDGSALGSLRDLAPSSVSMIPTELTARLRASPASG